MVLIVAIIQDGIVANVAVWDSESQWVIPPGCYATGWQGGMVIGEPWPVEPSDASV